MSHSDMQSRIRDVAFYELRRASPPRLRRRREIRERSVADEDFPGHIMSFVMDSETSSPSLKKCRVRRTRRGNRDFLRDVITALL